MRFVVLLFGFSGTLLTLAGVGVFLFPDQASGYVKEYVPREPAQARDLLSFIDQHTSMTKMSHANAAIFLLLAGIFGFLGTVLGFFRCGRQGGLLMLIPVLGAALMNPFSLIFTSLQALTALLAFFVGPLPIAADDD